MTPALARRVLPLLALLLAFAPTLAACGDDEETFKKEFKPVNARILALGRDVARAVSDASRKSDRQIEQQFGGLAKRTGTLQKQVDALEPPDDLADEQKNLGDAMGDARDALGDIEKAAGDGNPQAARRATIKLVAASTDLRAQRRRLARATGARL